MALNDLTLDKQYAAFTPLTEAQLDAAFINSIVDFINNTIQPNQTQLALDVFGNTYEYTNDGVAANATPLIDSVAQKDEDEAITGAWTFEDSVSFEQPVSSTSTFTSSAQPRVKAYRTTSNQSVTNNTLTAVSLNAESYDISAQHDNVVNPSRITVVSGTGGSYHFLAQVGFAANATGVRQVSIYKNGAAIATVFDVAASGTQDSYIQCAVDDEASVNDYYEIYVKQTSGGALDVLKDADKTFFSARKVW